MGLGFLIVTCRGMPSLLRQPFRGRCESFLESPIQLNCSSKVISFRRLLPNKRLKLAAPVRKSIQWTS